MVPPAKRKWEGGRGGGGGQESVVALSFEESHHEAETKAVRAERHWGRMFLEHRRARP